MTQPTNVKELRLHNQPVANTIATVNSWCTFSSWDSAVNIIDIGTQSVHFKKKLDAICYAKPVLKRTHLFLPTSEEYFDCIDINTGKTIWTKKTNGKITNFDFINDSIIILSVNHYGIIALNSIDGSHLYSLLYNYNTCNLPDLSPWLINFDKNVFYVTNWECCNLSAIESSTGKILWETTIGIEYYAGIPLLLGDNIFLGLNKSYKGGKVLLIEKNKGEVIFETNIPFESRMHPVLNGEDILFYTYDKKIYSFNFHSKQITEVVALSEENDCSGNQLFLINNAIFFSDNSFYINELNLKTRKIKRILKVESSLLHAIRFGKNIYFIMGSGIIKAI